MTTWSELRPDAKIEAVKLAWRPNIVVRHMLEDLPQGATKNAVIGVYNRNPDLRISHPLNACPIKRQYHRTVERSARVAKRVYKPVTVKAVVDDTLKRWPKMMAAISDGPVEPALYDAASMRLSLLELTNRTCRYPTHGQGEATFFCGHGAELEDAYCAHHRARCAGRGTESERGALKQLSRIIRAER